MKVIDNKASTIQYSILFTVKKLSQQEVEQKLADLKVNCSATLTAAAAESDKIMMFSAFI